MEGADELDDEPCVNSISIISTLASTSGLPFPGMPTDVVTDVAAPGMSTVVATDVAASRALSTAGIAPVREVVDKVEVVGWLGGRFVERYVLGRGVFAERGFAFTVPTRAVLEICGTEERAEVRAKERVVILVGDRVATIGGESGAWKTACADTESITGSVMVGSSSVGRTLNPGGTVMADGSASRLIAGATSVETSAGGTLVGTCRNAAVGLIGSVAGWAITSEGTVIDGGIVVAWRAIARLDIIGATAAGTSAIMEMLVAVGTVITAVCS
jgi:hypothetical protein